MEIAFKLDQAGKIDSVIKQISNPSAMVLMTTETNLQEHARLLKEAFPNVPFIGGVGMGYTGTTVVEKGVMVAVITGATVCADVLENASMAPVRYIDRLERAVSTVSASKNTSACFDFCTGYDGKIVTTLNLILEKKGIPLIGGTVDCGKVVCNGTVYEDACAFMMIKNDRGKILGYKENIYVPTGARFIATKTTPHDMVLNEVDGKPAESFYRETLGISKDAVATQTFKNPLGRVFGQETYLISIKEIKGSALACYKQVNDLDVLTMMELKDYRQIVEETVRNIKSDLPSVKGVLSVNCLFRYLLFQQEHYLSEYLSKMNFTSHGGLVGYGEHYYKQHINQTMCCLAFD